MLWTSFNKVTNECFYTGSNYQFILTIMKGKKTPKLPKAFIYKKQPRPSFQPSISVKIQTQSRHLRASTTVQVVQQLTLNIYGQHYHVGCVVAHIQYIYVPWGRKEIGKGMILCLYIYLLWTQIDMYDTTKHIQCFVRFPWGVNIQRNDLTCLYYLFIHYGHRTTCMMTT